MQLCTAENKKCKMEYLEISQPYKQIQSYILQGLQSSPLLHYLKLLKNFFHVWNQHVSDCYTKCWQIM